MKKYNINDLNSNYIKIKMKIIFIYIFNNLVIK